MSDPGQRLERTLKHIIDRFHVQCLREDGGASEIPTQQATDKYKALALGLLKQQRTRRLVLFSAGCAYGLLPSAADTGSVIDAQFDYDDAILLVDSRLEELFGCLRSLCADARMEPCQCTVGSKQFDRHDSPSLFGRCKQLANALFAEFRCDACAPFSSSPTWVAEVCWHVSRPPHYGAGWILQMTGHPVFVAQWTLPRVTPLTAKLHQRSWSLQCSRRTTTHGDHSSCSNSVMGSACSMTKIPITGDALLWSLAGLDLGPSTLPFIRTWLLVRWSGQWPPSCQYPAAPTVRDFCPVRCHVRVCQASPFVSVQAAGVSVPLR